MNEQEFIKKVRASESSIVTTGALNIFVRRYSPTKIEIVEKTERICPYCKTDLSKNKRVLSVEFNEDQENLTIFQSELLFMVFVLEKRPYDYAKYHECIAGERFIKNIKEIKIKED